jgi:hypothetical protein
MTAGAGARWTDDALDRWRQVADPVADPLAQEVLDAGGPAALGRLTRQLDDWEAPPPGDLTAGMRAYFDTALSYPAWVDERRIRHAEDLFAAFGPMTVSALLLNGYSQFLTCPAGARAMYAARVFSPESIASRMLEIVQFALFMGARDGLSLAPHAAGSPAGAGRSARAYRKLRIVHANIRLLLTSGAARDGWDAAALGRPINQEDLALGMLCFCLGSMDGLQKAGFDLSRDDQEAMLMAWRAAAWLLGLADDLQPADIPEAQALRARILARHQRGTREGAVVIREMLRIVERLLPPGTRRIPGALVRFQLGDRQADLIDVPNSRWLLAVIRGTEPLWQSTRLFAWLARLVSPRVLAWASSPTRLGADRRFELPPALAAKLGSPRGDR